MSATEKRALYGMPPSLVPAEGSVSLLEGIAAYLYQAAPRRTSPASWIQRTARVWVRRSYVSARERVTTSQASDSPTDSSDSRARSATA